MIGLLTEVIGSPTPIRIPLVARRQLPSNDLTSPVAPQEWHYRQSIEYALAGNRAVLDYASRHRDTLLYNIYLMGRHSIARGRRDTWMPRPPGSTKSSASPPAKIPPKPTMPPTSPTDRHRTPRLAPKYYDPLHKPAWRDPRGFIVPADQPDFPTAVKFINALLKTGVAVHRATAEFTVAGQRYPVGSYVVKTDQAFRPHVLDMFEPQDLPNDFKYEGSPPNKPYDVTGYTLAFQMDVKFTRVLDAFEGPFERLSYGQLQSPPAVRIAEGGAVAGFLVSHRQNDSFILLNRLMKAGAEAYWVKDALADQPELGRDAEARPHAHRALGPLQRLDALGLDALGAGAIRVSLRGHLRAAD